jgi:hypothetical protein
MRKNNSECSEERRSYSMGYPFNYDYHLAHPSEIKSLRSSAEMEAFKRVDSLYPDV